MKEDNNKSQAPPRRIIEGAVDRIGPDETMADFQEIVINCTAKPEWVAMLEGKIVFLQKLVIPGPAVMLAKKFVFTGIIEVKTLRLVNIRESMELDFQKGFSAKIEKLELVNPVPEEKLLELLNEIRKAGGEKTMIIIYDHLSSGNEADLYHKWARFSSLNIEITRKLPTGGMPK